MTYAWCESMRKASVLWQFRGFFQWFAAICEYYVICVLTFDRQTLRLYWPYIIGCSYIRIHLCISMTKKALPFFSFTTSTAVVAVAAVAAASTADVLTTRCQCVVTAIPKCWQRVVTAVPLMPVQSHPVGWSLGVGRSETAFVASVRVKSLRAAPCVRASCWLSVRLAVRTTTSVTEFS